MVLAATGPIGFPKRRSGGVLNYDAVHLVRGPLTHYNYYIEITNRSIKRESGVVKLDFIVRQGE